MKRALLLLGALLLALPGLAQAPPPPKVLKLWQFWPEAWIEPALADFEKETGYHVEVERLTWGDGLNKIITALAANQAPDVIELGSTWVAGFSQDGGLKELHPGPLKEQLNLWEPATYDGRIYAVPWTLSTGAIFYNLDLLERAGVAPPKDWNELAQASAKIRALSPEIYGYGIKTGEFTTWQKFLPFAWSNGAALMEGNQPRMEDPAFVEALNFYLSLKPSSLFDDNLIVRKAFAEGKVGFMMEEPGQIAKFQQENPALRFGVMPLPVSPRTGKSINFAGSQMLAITKSSQDVEAARQLIEYLVRPEVTAAITQKITTLFPAHKNAMADDFYQKQHPELLVFLETLQTATSPQAHPQFVEIQDIFSENLERSLFGLVSGEEAMAVAARDIERLLAETQEQKGPPIDFDARWIYFPLGGIALLAGLLWMWKYQQSQATERTKALRRLRYNRNTLLFLAPWLLVFLLFSLYPIAHSFFLSFTHFRATDESGPSWVGLSNYIKLIGDDHFLDALQNSFWFMIGTVPPILALALLLAVILNQRMKLRTFYRVSFFMPVVTSVMVIATLFIELYAPEGIINNLLQLMGLEGRHWLKDPDYALISIMFMNIWASFGFYTLMLLAGLQNIPEEYYEASSLEGAGKWRQFFTITLPLLKPTLLVAAIMDCLLAFQVFGEIWIMTQGGPLRSTETGVYYLYDLAFHKQKMGYGSAAAYYIFLILVLFSAAQFLGLGRRKA